MNTLTTDSDMQRLAEITASLPGRIARSKQAMAEAAQQRAQAEAEAAERNAEWWRAHDAGQQPPSLRRILSLAGGR